MRTAGREQLPRHQRDGYRRHRGHRGRRGCLHHAGCGAHAAGLVDTLKGPGPFTVFAPTDDDFAKLPAGTVEELLKDPTGQLAEILKYHVVAGEVRAADVVKLNGQKVKTVQGAELTVEVNSDKVALVDAAGNRVHLVTTDVAASNGVIHIIDGVLLPVA